MRGNPFRRPSHRRRPKLSPVRLAPPRTERFPRIGLAVARGSRPPELIRFLDPFPGRGPHRGRLLLEPMKTPQVRAAALALRRRARQLQPKRAGQDPVRSQAPRNPRGSPWLPGANLAAQPLLDRNPTVGLPPPPLRRPLLKASFQTKASEVPALQASLRPALPSMARGKERPPSLLRQGPHPETPESDLCLSSNPGDHRLCQLLPRTNPGLGPRAR